MVKFLLMLLTIFIYSLTAVTPIPSNVDNNVEYPLCLRYPAVSPDGQTMVFCYKGDIFKIPVSGCQTQPLTSLVTHAPDHRDIAFAPDQYGKFDIYILPILPILPIEGD